MKHNIRGHNPSSHSKREVLTVKENEIGSLNEPANVKSLAAGQKIPADGLNVWHMHSGCDLLLPLQRPTVSNMLPVTIVQHPHLGVAGIRDEAQLTADSMVAFYNP